MKTTVIQLEAHDDVTSIKDKMAWQSCQRMILVWPKRGRVLNNELELVLLNREARSLGAELALVTHHPTVREWALDSYLPLFASISAAEKDLRKNEMRDKLPNKVPRGGDAIKVIKEALPKQPSSTPKFPFIRGLALAISFVALIALIIVIFPQAVVTYYPKISLQEIEIRIKASEVFSGINPSGNIPEKPLFLELSGEKSVPSSGKVAIPTTKAAGEVVFTNLTQAAVTLPVGTLLLAGSDPLTSFSLTDAVVVPAGLHKTAVAKVEALLAGRGGNLAAESTWTLSGGMDSLLGVSNPEPFIGGGDVETPSPSDEDYVNLERLLLADLMEQGINSFRSEQKEEVGLIEPSLILDQILLSEHVNKSGEPADEAMLRMNVRLKIFTYSQSDLKAISDLVLSSTQPAGYKPLTTDVTIEKVGDFRVDDFGQATWMIKASRLLVPDWNTELAANDLTGMKVSDANSVFSGSFTQSSPPKIKVWFNGWPWMPFLSTNIHFKDGVVS